MKRGLVYTHLSPYSSSLSVAVPAGVYYSHVLTVLG